MDIRDFVNGLDSHLFIVLRDAVQARVALQSDELTEEEKQMVRDGNLIPTVKSIRARLGIGLFEAKQMLDKYQASLTSGT